MKIICLICTKITHALEKRNGTNPSSFGESSIYITPLGGVLSFGENSIYIPVVPSSF